MDFFVQKIHTCVR